MNDIDSKIDERLSPGPESTPAPEPKTEAPEPEAPEPETPEEENVPRETSDADDSTGDGTDEYGNEVPKQEKTYTEAQVQAMIRDRLSRGQNTQKQEPQQPQAKQFEYDSSSSESWEQQLEQFMDGWASKREQRQQEQQWKQAEQQKQTEFESKFNDGMSRYSDFRDVVATAPIDDTMLIATRGMKDPAAFIYAASKKQPAELQRISQINDPYAKMAEIGRLDERMKKDRTAKSKAPKPSSKTHGDALPRNSPRSVDDRIAEYAEKRLRRS